MTTTDEIKQVESVIEEWRSALLAKDAARVKTLWDQDYSKLFYVASENDDHLAGWAAIDEYYNILDMVGEISLAIDNLKRVQIMVEVGHAFVEKPVKQPKDLRIDSADP